MTAVRATRITDAMMTAAASAICGAATIHQDPHGMLLPDRAHLAQTATTVARAVARAAVADGVAPGLTGAGDRRRRAAHPVAGQVPGVTGPVRFSLRRIQGITTACSRRR